MSSPQTPMAPPAAVPPTEQTRAAWDAIASGYDRYATSFNVDLAGRLLDRVDIRPGLRVLDVACGSGALAISAARRGAHVVAVDLAPAMIERLEARTGGEGPLDLEGRVMDGQALDLEPGTVRRNPGGGPPHSHERGIGPGRPNDEYVTSLEKQEEIRMRTHDDTTTHGDGRRERTETVIIGGGQAGLSVGQQLTERGRRFVILEAKDRIGDNWRRHYDSLRLYNPAKLCSLPGMDFPGPGDRYPTRDEVAAYLEDYAAAFDLPVRTGTSVDEVRREGDTYIVAAGDREIEADNVVVATGTFGGPHTPPFASDLDPRIRQLHSSEYKNPSQLQTGRVLVVGAAHSGADIAFELAGTHDTVLAGRDTGQVPFDIEGRGARFLWPVLSFVARRLLTLKTPIGRKSQAKIRAHGGPLIRYKTADLVEAGVERVEARVTGAVDGQPVLDDGRVLDVANVIWATGFRQDFGWIRLPVVGEDGWPREERGVVPDAPGLYFVGLAFQYSFGSMLFVGVGQDARYVAAHLDSRTPAARATAAAS